MLEIHTPSSSRSQAIPVVILSVPQMKISVPREWRKRYQERGIRECKGSTKGWNDKVKPSGLTPKDDKKLK